MVAFSYRMPSGVAGDVNRAATGMTIEAQVITPTGTTGHPTTFGIAVIQDATGGNVGNMRMITTGDTAVYGLLVREYPTQSSNWPTDGFGAGTPPQSGLVSILKRGYMTVFLQGATAAAKGGAVYAYNTTTDTSHIILGGIEAATSTNAILLPNSYFMGPADANGITEIAFNI